VGVQTSIASSARQRFVVFEGDMAARPGILVAFSEAEVDDVDYVLLLLNAN